MTTDFSGLGLAEGPETAHIRAFLEAAGASARVGSPDPGSGAEISIPVGDDAAAFRVPHGEHVVVSSDASVEGIHFRREWMTWETIGYRAAAAALSDLAAMAAAPIGLVVSAALPPELGIETASALGRGVGEASATVGAAILGGDLTASPGPVFVDVTVLGHAAHPVRRVGARPGDELWVTGELGGAAAAVHSLTHQLEPDPISRSAFERPRPRIAEARWLAERGGIHAAMDISDGLMRDARHLATASGVGIEIDAALVPGSEPLERLRGTPPGTRFLLAGGEDYELLLAAEPGSLAASRGVFEAAFDVRLTRIGQILAGGGLHVLGLVGDEVGDGFDHFEIRA